MRILVLRALGLGDLLTAVPALRALRRAFPGAEITLAAPGWLSDAVARIDAVDRLLPTEGLTRIEYDSPDLAVNLHGRGPQSVERLMATRPRLLLTHDEWPEDRHEVLRWCDLLQEHGIPCDADDLLLSPPGPRTERIVVHPGASHGARRWPVERFGAVVRELDGHDVVVTASPSELEAARRIVPEPVCGSLGQLLDLVATAGLVICGDTGVAHVATAYGTPSVLLFGPMPPSLWGPRSGPHHVLWHGGTGDTFASEPDPGLLRITVDEVLDAVKELRPVTAGRGARP
ncbi:glycosyltransferase family 9 protein [Lentzea sp. NEAU-D7]|uniref:glycosyltransferase family 9 protein n=1 Tax=Lentzea sp. NEAU-D7 TaxID=2994667 RepID=UPI00224AE98E|nr:glycosyltransferase family 9 protein [Lentzea sp. NEAU-D7]MCX2946981.1 glycosyltransferase family 9 protein [Lentzea sp. NEAU-D7]